MNGVLADMTKRMKAVEGAPALQMTPDTLAERMQAAATRARQEDRASLLEAKQEHVDAAEALWKLHGRVATIHDQHRRLLWAAGGGLLAGCLLWSFLPGVILRALPQGWHMPEAMAAHIIGEPTLWEAGTRLMRAGSPQTWDALTEAAEMLRDNRDTIGACEQAAAKGKKAVRCTITIGKPQS